MKRAIVLSIGLLLLVIPFTASADSLTVNYLQRQDPIIIATFVEAATDATMDVYPNCRGVQLNVSYHRIWDGVLQLLTNVNALDVPAANAVSSYVRGMCDEIQKRQTQLPQKPKTAA